MPRELTRTKPQAETLLQQRYDEQESKRAKPVQIDQRGALNFWLGMVAVGFIASGVLSFNGITAEAQNIGLAEPWMQFFMFFVVEWFYLVFLGGFLFKESRSESSTAVQSGMWFFGGVAVYSNAMHSLNFNDWDFTSVNLWTGLILGVSAPIAVIASSKLTSSIVFAKRVEV